MSLNKERLKQRIITNLEQIGFVRGEYSQFEVFAQAFSDAVVDEIQQNSEVPVTGGSSAGTYKVK